MAKKLVEFNNNIFIKQEIFNRNPEIFMSEFYVQPEILK